MAPIAIHTGLAYQRRPPPCCVILISSVLSAVCACIANVTGAEMAVDFVGDAADVFAALAATTAKVSSIEKTTPRMLHLLSCSQQLLE